MGFYWLLSNSLSLWFFSFAHTRTHTCTHTRTHMRTKWEIHWFDAIAFDAKSQKHHLFSKISRWPSELDFHYEWERVEQLWTVHLYFCVRSNHFSLTNCKTLPQKEPILRPRDGAAPIAWLCDDKVPAEGRASLCSKMTAPCRGRGWPFTVNQV